MQRKTSKRAHTPAQIKSPAAKIATPIPTDSAARKTVPMGTGLIDYFPAALAGVANISYKGNEKHNPGQPLHWARGKSMDHADCVIRHYTERGTNDAEGNSHTAQMCWRALALYQEELEAAGAPRARGAWDMDNAPGCYRHGNEKGLAAP